MGTQDPGTGQVIPATVRERARTRKEIFKYNQERRDRAGTGKCFPSNSDMDHTTSLSTVRAVKWL